MSYNSFGGNTTTFGDLSKLNLIQIHGNRLSGTIPRLNLAFERHSDYVSDCGSPSEFEDTLLCEECTMCCNSQGYCYPSAKTTIQEAGFGNYSILAVTFLSCIFGASCFVALISYTIDNRITRDKRFSTLRRMSILNRDAKYALSAIGEGSVYRFFLGTSLVGWTITLAVMGAQVGTLFLFIHAAEIVLSDDSKDLVYTWLCPRDQDQCRDTGDVDWRGWVVLAILLVAHLLKDVSKSSYAEESMVSEFLSYI